MSSEEERDAKPNLEPTYPRTLRESESHDAHLRGRNPDGQARNWTESPSRADHIADPNALSWQEERIFNKKTPNIKENKAVFTKLQQICVENDTPPEGIDTWLPIANELRAEYGLGRLYDTPEDLADFRPVATFCGFKLYERQG